MELGSSSSNGEQSPMKLQEAFEYTTSPSVTYPDSLDAAADDFSPVPSQVSSFASLSVSPQLTSASVGRRIGNDELQKQVNNNSRSDDGTTSTSTVSEWEGPHTDESEVNIIVVDRKQEHSRHTDDQAVKIIETPDKAISNVVWKSIMFGPVDDSDEASDEESDHSNSSSEVLLDQSTLTTTTSYITVLANEEPKDDISDTKSVSDAAAAVLAGALLQHSLTETNMSEKTYSSLEKTNDGFKEEPISSMLLDALEDIEGAELSGGEDQGNNLCEEEVQSLPTVEEHAKVYMAESESVDVPTTNDSLQKSGAGDDKQDLKEKYSNCVDNTRGMIPDTMMKKSFVLIHGNDNESSPSSCTSHRSADATATEHTNIISTDLVSSSSGELLLSYSKEDMLTSSDIKLDLLNPHSSNDLPMESERESPIISEIEMELPDGTSTDEKLSFILEKMCLLQQRQNMILCKLKESQQARTKETAKYKKKIKSIIKKLESDEAARNKEKKRQNDRIELIENAVVELGRHYTGHYQPLLGARPIRKSSISHQKAEKLKNFFGAQPPLLHQFLKDLGYEEYIPRFENEKIGLKELCHMQGEDLADLGLPLGPRLRILHEAKQL